MSTVTTEAHIAQNIFATMPNHNFCALPPQLAFLTVIALRFTWKLHYCWGGDIFSLLVPQTITLVGSEYCKLTEIIRTLLFPAVKELEKVSTLHASKYPWGFNMGFTWVQIVEVQALDAHYGWKTAQPFCSKNKKHGHRGSAHWTQHVNHLTCCNPTFSMTYKSILCLEREMFISKNQ